MITMHYTNFNNAWASMVNKLMNSGKRMYADSTLRKETMDVTAAIVLEGAAIDQILERSLHHQYPQKQQGLTAYVKQFEYDSEEHEISMTQQPYTYAGRLRPWIDTTHEVFNRNNQMHTMNYVDAIKRDIPCLQRIWIRYFPDGTCEVHFIYRSHDLYGAWQFNMIALVNYVCQYVIGDYRINKIVEFNDSLHIYDYDWVSASMVTQETRLLR